jgi:hypothetical protein
LRFWENQQQNRRHFKDSEMNHFYLWQLDFGGISNARKSALGHRHVLMNANSASPSNDAKTIDTSPEHVSRNGERTQFPMPSTRQQVLLDQGIDSRSSNIAGDYAEDQSADRKRRVALYASDPATSDLAAKILRVYGYL